MANGIAELLSNPIIQQKIRYNLGLIVLKRKILSGRPRSEHELTSRIEEYLRVHPKIGKMFSDAGVSISQIVSKFEHYAK